MTAVTFERKARNALASLIGLFSPPKKITPAALKQVVAQGRIRKVLLLRPHQGLGDFLLATPMFRALKKGIPGLSLHVLPDSYNEVSVRHNPYIDKLWPWDKKAMQNPFELIRFMRAMRKEGIDLAIPLTSHVPSFTSYLLAKFSGAKWICGYDTAPYYDGATWSRSLCDVELPAPDPSIPEYDKFLNLVRPFVRDDGVEPDFFLGNETRLWADERWKELGLSDKSRVIGIFLGGNPDRQDRLWPPDHWAQLFRRLQDAGHEVMAIVPPPNLRSGSRAKEPGIYDLVRPHLKKEPIVFSEKELDRLAAFLSHLSLFICSDGGLFHIAVSARVRTLVMFFASAAKCWIAPVPWVTPLQSPTPDPGTITVDRVLNEVETLCVESAR